MLGIWKTCAILIFRNSKTNGKLGTNFSNKRPEANEFEPSSCLMDNLTKRIGTDLKCEMIIEPREKIANLQFA
jgi:hypothetical protein